MQRNYYLARDKDGKVYVFKGTEPFKLDAAGRWCAACGICREASRDYPHIRWEDDKAHRIELTFKTEKKCRYTQTEQQTAATAEDSSL